MLSKLITRISLLSVMFTGMATAEESPRERLQRHLAALHSYQAVFVQVVTDAQEQVLQQAHGQLHLLQPDMLHWQVDAPNENILIADGESVWHIDPFVEQVVAMRQDAAIANNPMILLTSSDPEDWQAFKISEPAPGKFHVVTDDEDAFIKMLEIGFEQETLVSLTFIDSQGQHSMLTFSDIRQNQPVEEALFVFSLPEGFDLDDQRNP